MSLNWPQAHVVFCDDVRQEVGGKFSLMGVYDGEILTHGPQAPPQLDRISGVVFLEWPKGKAKVDDAWLEIVIPGQNVAPVPLDGFSQHLQAEPDRTSDRANIFFGFSGPPFVPGKAINVVLRINGRRRTLGTLAMQHNPAAPTPTP